MQGQTKGVGSSACYCIAYDGVMCECVSTSQSGDNECFAGTMCGRQLNAIHAIRSYGERIAVILVGIAGILHQMERQGDGVCSLCNNVCRNTQPFATIRIQYYRIVQCQIALDIQPRRVGEYLHPLFEHGHSIVFRQGICRELEWSRQVQGGNDEGIDRVAVEAAAHPYGVAPTERSR